MIFLRLRVAYFFGNSKVGGWANEKLQNLHRNTLIGSCWWDHYGKIYTKVIFLGPHFDAVTEGWQHCDDDRMEFTETARRDIRRSGDRITRPVTVSFDESAIQPKLWPFVANAIIIYSVSMTPGTAGSCKLDVSPPAAQITRRRSRPERGPGIGRLKTACWFRYDNLYCF